MENGCTITEKVHYYRRQTDTNKIACHILSARPHLKKKKKKRKDCSMTYSGFKKASELEKPESAAQMTSIKV